MIYIVYGPYEEKNSEKELTHLTKDGELLINVHDAFAIHELLRVFEERKIYKSDNIKLIRGTVDDLADMEENYPVICIGGPIANGYVRKLQDDPPSCFEGAWLWFPEGEKELFDGDRHIQDRESACAFVTKADPEASESWDFGILSKFKHKGRVHYIIAGNWGAGTRGVVNFFINPNMLHTLSEIEDEQSVQWVVKSKWSTNGNPLGIGVLRYHTDSDEGDCCEEITYKIRGNDSTDE